MASKPDYPYNRYVQTNVLIIGAGELGQVLAGLLCSNPMVNLRIWDRDKEKCSHSEDLADLLSDSDIVLYSAPSWVLTSLLKDNAGAIRPDSLWYVFSKGIDPDTKQYMDDVLHKNLSKSVSWAVIGGPMLAEELEANTGGVAVIGTYYLECARGFDHLFHHLPSIRISISDDPHGVAVGGTVKNIYALFLGLINGLGYGFNLRSYYTSYCLHEMLSLGVCMGSRLPTLLGPAGLGDLLATSSGTYSTNFSTGMERSKGPVNNPKGEGINTLEQVFGLLGDQISQFPLLRTIYDIFVDQKDPSSAIKALENL